MERLTTGNEELDAVLGGGLPTGTFVVVAGPPGSGKSVLATQLAFHNATADRPAYKYSTLSESPAKMRRHMADFSFFDETRFETDVRLIQLSEFTEQAQAEGGNALAAMSDELLRRAYRENPCVVIVDSSRALEAYGSQQELRAAVFELASKMGRSDTVLVFVGEYASRDLDAPELAVADVIIELANDADTAQDRRTLRVAKLRGSGFVGGQHPFVITADGLEVHRRMETIMPAEVEVAEGRASFGEDQLDGMTWGGLPRGEVAVVLGPSGTGKTTLALHWVHAALARGETALYLALEEGVPQLTSKADEFGLDFSSALADGRLSILHAPAALADLDELGLRLRRALASQQPDVVAVDAVSSILPTLRAHERSPGYEAAMTGLLRSAGVTALLTYEIRSLGGAGVGSDGFSNLANTVLMLRYMERGAELGRVLSVLKMRRSQHDKGLLQFRISAAGLEVVGEADDVRQITGWTVLGSPTAT